MLDLFAGCGGLTDGFMQTGDFLDVAGVEWKKAPVMTLRHRLKTKYSKENADESILHFDIQREEELFNGWKNDNEYGSSKGLDYYVNEARGIDIIIGGPPCQAYSIAGRVRDENGMKQDYRNYLFEHYLATVDRYQPDLFVFENVPGLLSAAPQGRYVSEIITEEFSKKGYDIYSDLRKTLQNASEYNVPQNRNRLIIVGLRRKSFQEFNIQELLNDFYYNILVSTKGKNIISVQEAIGDLPPCKPYFDALHHEKRVSHSTPICSTTWHTPRYSNLRDMDTFKLLAEDIETGARIYNSQKIAELYEQKVGSKSPIHRYHVLNPTEPSTTIIAHLYKDGNRFIHYDSKQCRTITPREAARLQSFTDDFEFLGSRGDVYEMIGNAVPPQLGKSVAESIEQFLIKYKPEKYG